MFSRRSEAWGGYAAIAGGQRLLFQSVVPSSVSSCVNQPRSELLAYLRRSSAMTASVSGLRSVIDMATSRIVPRKVASASR